MNWDWQALKSRLLRAGAVAVGITEARPVEEDAVRRYEEWLAKGYESGMGYMHNHMEIRKDPRLLLEGARSIVCMAFAYGPGNRDPELPRISAYALQQDYHDTIRLRLRAEGLEELLGAEGEDWRICVDSAPLMERYWAVRAGIGTIEDNGMLTVPGYGSRVFLAEIVTTLTCPKGQGAVAKPDEPVSGCTGCGACRRACPTGALQADGTIDCDRCLSYLTIEHRGEWTDPRHIAAMNTSAGRATLFGCDRCMSACPLNRNALSASENANSEYYLPAIADLTVEEIQALDDQALSRRLKGSALKRAKPLGLRRNASHLK